MNKICSLSISLKVDDEPVAPFEPPKQTEHPPAGGGVDIGLAAETLNRKDTTQLEVRKSVVREENK